MAEQQTKKQKGERKLRRGPKDRNYYASGKYRTERNKARKAKKYAKWLAKRQEKNKAKGIGVVVVKHINRKNRGSNHMGLFSTHNHTIRFRSEEDGKVSYIDGLLIEGSEPEGYSKPKKGIRSGVHFLTKGGKKWFLPLSSFSIVINRKVA